jgi:hypothetical protein
VKFSIGQILSMGTGRLCCQMDGVYEVANFLTGDNLFTHQLVRAFKVCQPWVRSQCPWLAEVDETGCTPETWKPWLAALTAKHGEFFELQPLPAGVWESQDPIAELVAMVGKDKVIVAEM